MTVLVATRPARKTVKPIWVHNAYPTLATHSHLWRNAEMPSKEELAQALTPPPRPEIKKKYHYKEAFIMSPKLQCRIVQVRTISDGIAILDALSDGKLRAEKCES